MTIFKRLVDQILPEVDEEAESQLDRVLAKKWEEGEEITIGHIGDVEEHNLRVNLTEESYQDLQSICEEREVSMTFLVKTALGMAKLVNEAEQEGQSFVLMNQEGEIVKEVQAWDKENS